MNKFMKISALVTIIALIMFAGWSGYKNVSFKQCNEITQGFTGQTAWSPFQNSENSCLVGVGNPIHFVTWKQFSDNMIYYGQGGS